MMCNLEIKRVPFLGTELMAARDEGGRIWAGVKWMCTGIGLSKNQTDNQIQKIQSDKVLAKGAGIFPLPTRGGTQDSLCLALDFVPLWLAKISITPTMGAENPELAATLEQYQLRAKDVLAAAFLPKKHSGAQAPKRPALSSVNGAVKLILGTMEEAGVAPEYRVLALKGIYEPYGLPVPTDGLPAVEKLYDLTTMAEKLGVMSAKSGKPHAQAVGAILGLVGVMEAEVKVVPFINNGHSGTTEQYAESVLKRVHKWLEVNGWPTTIKSVGGTKYKVRYDREAR